MSSHEFDTLCLTYKSEKEPGKMRLFRLIEHVKGNDRFQTKQDMDFRGSFVDYGANYTLYKFTPLGKEGHLYPALVLSLSNINTMKFAHREIELGSLVNFLVSNDLRQM